MKCSRTYRALFHALAVGTVVWGLAFANDLSAKGAQRDADDWVTAWTTSTFSETPGKNTPALEGATFRQIVQVTLAARTIRVRFGNFFGTEPLQIGGVRIGEEPALVSSKKIKMKWVRFGGSKSVTVPPGGTVVSDPVRMDVTALENLAIDTYFTKLPETLTVHSASRANSYLYPGDTVGGSWRNPTQKCTRWYFLCDVEARAPGATAVSVFGDSIADGNGISDDSYARWLNVLSRRIQSNSATRNIAILNSSIGTNCLLTDGMTPKALSRVYRDVFDLHGVRTMIIALGVNDLGTGHYARQAGKQGASPDEIIGAIEKITNEAHDRGIYVICATITPYKGADFYWDGQGEADRLKVNEWIRKTDIFDGIVDFDAVVSDPADSQRLLAKYDKGDHLHHSVDGYIAEGDAVPIELLKKFAEAGPRATARQTE